MDILQPSKAIDNNFVSYSVVSDDGNSYTGLIVAETPTSITLKMPEGKTVVLLRTNVEEIRSNGISLMPEGLERNIPLQADGRRDQLHQELALPRRPGSRWRAASRSDEFEVSHAARERKKNAAEKCTRMHGNLEEQQSAGAELACTTC